MNKVGHGIQFFVSLRFKASHASLPSDCGAHVLREIQPCSAERADYLLRMAQPRLRRGVIIRSYFPFFYGALPAVSFLI